MTKANPNPKTLRGPGPSDLDGLDVPSPVEVEAGGRALHDYADRSDTLRDAVKVLMRTDAGGGGRRTQPDALPDAPADAQPDAQPSEERGGDGDEEIAEQDDADGAVEEELPPRVARRAIRRAPPEEPPRRTRLWFAIAAMFLFVSLLALIAWQGAGTTDGTNPTAAPTDAVRTAHTAALTPTPTAIETQAPAQAESSAPVATITPTHTAVAPATIATTAAKPTATATVTSSPTAGPKTSSSAFWVMKGTP